jgi:solute carrier family 25 carnitine/acylcarnitine transporter 20/29
MAGISGYEGLYEVVTQGSSTAVSGASQHMHRSVPMWTVVKAIYSRDGVRGFFRGTVPSVLKAGPNTAVTFATYELCIRFCSKLHEDC